MVRKRIGIGLLIVSTLLLVSCKSEVIEENLVIVESEDDVISYRLATVERDDVSLSKTIKVNYKQTNEQEVAFTAAGKIVDKVYVEEGDHVSKGDLLVELSYSSIEEKIEDVKYKIERNELLLSYLDTDEDYEISAIWLSGGNEEMIKSRVESIQENYENKRISYEDELEFDRMELKKLQSELSGTRIYAQMDGIVYDLKERLEGSTSKKDEVIMTIVDNTECLFESDQIEYKDCFEEGKTASMTISYGSSKGSYELMPKDISSWTDTMVFEVFSGPDDVAIDVGVSGNLTVILDYRENVLTVPSTVVFNADGKDYVYVLDENNLRVVRWVETGLVGTEKTEILSGLEEGEKVVKR